VGYEFELEGELHNVHPIYDLEETRLSIDEVPVRAELTPALEPGAFLLEIDGRVETVFVATEGDVHFIQLDGVVHRVVAPNALERARRAANPSGGAETLAAPMPGTVIQVAVEAGEIVNAGALLVTIESMKLQTAITATEAARVAEVCVAPGDTFDQGDALVRLEPVEIESDPESTDAQETRR
jgi:biotin carboxyl carrier protein